MLTRGAVISLIEWWASAGKAPFPSVPVADDIVFDGAFYSVQGALDFLNVEHHAELKGLKILRSITEGESCVVFFEAVDGVTLMKHRTAWLVECNERGEIARIVAVNSPGYVEEE